jgi:hypothetical protein
MMFLNENKNQEYHAYLISIYSMMYLQQRLKAVIKREIIKSNNMTLQYLKVFFMLFWGLLATVSIHAQQSVNGSGANATGSAGTVSYSIGQVFYTTHTGTTGSVAQGVQQAYNISVVNTWETTLNIALTAFPNPTTDKLTLSIGDYNNEKYVYQLFDAQGKLIHNGQILTANTLIDMTGLPPATYFLTVIHSDYQKFKTFKVLKNQ